MQATCPSCGITTVLRNEASIRVVCSGCRSFLSLSESDIKILGIVAESSLGNTALKIGLNGSYQNHRFTVLGRIRKRTEDFIWDEWCLDWKNGTFKWLAEAQGCFFLFIPIPDHKFSADQEWHEDEEIQLGEQTFQTREKKQVYNENAEGEFPIPLTINEPILTLNLESASGSIATIEKYLESVEVYVGKGCDLDELGIINQIEKNLVSSSPAPILFFTCPQCQGQIGLHAGYHTQIATCPTCNSLLDFTKKKPTLIKKLPKSSDYGASIPVGSRGMLLNDQWTVIGCIRQQDTQSLFSWEEYILFNPFKGFRWLVEANGHWSFVRPFKGKMEVRNGVATNGKESFKLFNQGKVKTINLRGEFYWRISIGDRYEVTDFIAPPIMVTREKRGGETVWSRGEHLSTKEVKQAFRLRSLPITKGVAPNQPAPWGNSRSGINIASGIMVFILIVLQFFFVDKAGVKKIWSGHSFAPPDTGLGIPTFELMGPMHNLEIEMRSDVVNQWIELQGDLVNINTGERRGFEVGAEYYSGVDDGEAWSEGSSMGSVVFSSIPPGKYQIISHASIDPRDLTPIAYDINVKSDVPIWSNFWLTLMLLGFIPAYIAVRQYFFERSRWIDSSENPWQKENQ